MQKYFSARNNFELSEYFIIIKIPLTCSFYYANYNANAIENINREIT